MDTERLELIGTFDNFEVTIDKVNDRYEDRVPHFHIERIKKVGEYDWEKGFEIATGYYLTHGHGNNMFTDHEFKVINEGISAFWPKILKAWNRDHHYKVAETLKCPVLRLRDYSIKALARDYRVILNHLDDFVPYEESWDYIGQERLEFEQDQQSIIGVHPWDRYMIIDWQNDLEQHVPHIHIVDLDTCGNLFNAAYTLDTGEFFPHGSVRHQLSQEMLDCLNEHMRTTDHDTMDWLIYEWNLDNSFKFRVGIDVPDKHPTFTNNPYSKPYKSETAKQVGDRLGKLDVLHGDKWNCGETEHFKFIIWEGDKLSYHPHFHVVDRETEGEKVNAVYRIDTGKWLKHGDKRYVLRGNQLIDCSSTCRTILTFDELQEVQAYIRSKTDGGFKRIKRHWVDCVSRKNLKKKTPVPRLSNY